MQKCEIGSCTVVLRAHGTVHVWGKGNEWGTVCLYERG